MQYEATEKNEQGGLWRIRQLFSKNYHGQNMYNTVLGGEDLFGGLLFDFVLFWGGGKGGTKCIYITYECRG